MEGLSERGLEQLWDFLQGLKSDKEFVDNDAFERLLREDSEKYKETYKRLA